MALCDEDEPPAVRCRLTRKPAGILPGLQQSVFKLEPQFLAGVSSFLISASDVVLSKQPQLHKRFLKIAASRYTRNFEAFAKSGMIAAVGVRIWPRR